MKQKTKSVNRGKEARFIKTGAAAVVLGVTPNCIRAAVRRGDLPGIELGSRILVSREGLERLVAGAVERGPEPANVA